MFKERNKYIISFCCQVIIVEISSTMLLFLRIFFVLFICIYIYHGQTVVKHQESFLVLRKIQKYLKIFRLQLFFSSKMLLEKKSTISIKVDRFKTEIVRASRGFILGLVPKLLREPAGDGRYYRTVMPLFELEFSTLTIFGI